MWFLQRHRRREVAAGPQARSIAPNALETNLYAGVRKAELACDSVGGCDGRVGQEFGLARHRKTAEEPVLEAADDVSGVTSEKPQRRRCEARRIPLIADDDDLLLGAD
jgi:hypothetical protein